MKIVFTMFSFHFLVTCRGRIFDLESFWISATKHWARIYFGILCLVGFIRFFEVVITDLFYFAANVLVSLYWHYILNMEEEVRN